MDFIPARKSYLFTRIFRVYTKWLFKYHFSNIWIHPDYHPGPDSRTVYFLNHTSWWDGLIPLMLNEYHFKQDGRAMMELKQMKKYPFFKWLGAFSVQPDDSTHTLASLKYAVKSMHREHSSLYIYPQGETSPVTSKVDFKQGLGWLYKQLPEVDFVPVGIHMHTIRHAKPELHIWIGRTLKTDRSQDRGNFTHICEQQMDNILGNLIATAGVEDKLYKRFL